MLTTEELLSSKKVADLADRLDRENTAWDDVDLDQLHATLPKGLAAAILQLGKTCCKIDARIESLEKRMVKAERDALLARCKPSLTAPFDRGCTRFMGDYPKHDQEAEAYIGKLWELQGTPLKFAKNDTNRALTRGERLDTGTVDTELRRDFVPPNDYYWLEIA
jgi:hypothetical protein